MGTLEGVQERLDLGPERLTIPHVERADSPGDNGIEPKILGDTRLIRQWALMGGLRKRLKDRFDKEGIENAWPHNKVYFNKTPKAETTDQRPV